MQKLMSSDGFEWAVGGQHSECALTHECWLYDFIREAVEGKTFVDVGAHVGTHTVRAAKTASRVIAFEPNRAARALLMANLVLNQCDNVEVRMSALAAYDGEAYLTDEQSWSKLSDHPPGAIVPVSRLDSELGHLEDVALCKVDVEGGELAVLEGAAMSLPVFDRWLVECHDFSFGRDQSVKDLCAWFEHRGYRTTIWQAPLVDRYDYVEAWR